jgi:hypothetical protein
VVRGRLVHAINTAKVLEGQIMTLSSLSVHKKGTLVELLRSGRVDGAKIVEEAVGFELMSVTGVISPTSPPGLPFRKSSRLSRHRGHQAIAIRDVPGFQRILGQQDLGQVS